MPKARRKIKESPERIDCPVAPVAQASVYSRALHAACVILGGIEPLAKHLGVSTAQLRTWITGNDQPPMPVLMAAVQVVLLHLEKTGRAS
jgi:hypothetical protein